MECSQKFCYETPTHAVRRETKTDEMTFRYCNTHLNDCSREIAESPTTLSTIITRLKD